MLQSKAASKIGMGLGVFATLTDLPCCIAAGFSPETQKKNIITKYSNKYKAKIFYEWNTCIVHGGGGDDN